MKDGVLDRYLRTIDPDWVVDIERVAKRLIQDGWSLESYELGGSRRKCYFEKGSQVVYLMAPAKRWWHWLVRA